MSGAPTGGIATRAVRTLARTLPVRVRERYREEWEADVAGAAEAGLRPGSVVVGAAVTALTIDRLSPAITGIAPGRVVAHRLSAAIGFGSAAAILLIGYQLYGAYRNPADRGQSGGEALAAAALAVPAVAVVLGILAAVAVIGAMQATIAGRQYGLALALPLGFAGLLVVVALWGGILGLMAGAPALVAIVALAIALTGRADGTPPASRRSRLLATGFPLAALGLCALGLLHVYVWNPLAAVPGLTLDEIYAALAAANEATGSGVWGVVWAIGTVLAALGYLVLLVLGARRPWASSTRRLVAVGALLVAGTMLFGFLAAFGMGMGIADAFLTSGGDFAITGPILAIAGQLALAVAVLATFVRPAPRPRAQPVTA